MLEKSVPGIPGEDYPIYAEVPETAFACDGQVDGGKINYWFSRHVKYTKNFMNRHNENHIIHFIYLLHRILCRSRSWLPSIPHLHCWWTRRSSQVLISLSKWNHFQPKLFHLWLVVQFWLCWGWKPLFS